MSPESRDAKAARIRHLLETEGEAVAANTRGFNEGRYESVAELDDYQALREEARAIKEDAIERLPELIEQLTETVEANGGTVYVADDAADANEYVAEVCARQDAERLVKSKSMTSEEIEVNDHLQSRGVDVVETDLGEWVLQLAEESPSHIVAPAIHRSRESIAELFAETFDRDDFSETAVPYPPETAEELTTFARERLLEKIETADVGMTGANFLAADTGTMALVTSEGNARKTVAVPDTHVAVAGVEKIVPSVTDIQPFVELIGRSGTGQDITSYISLLTPPVNSPPVDFDEPETPLGSTETDREFHLVLIDNGRLAMREDEDLRETLYCIRCSACSNTCANFQSVGGHAFGGETYSGGIATGWEAGVEDLDTAAEFNDLCTGCSRCVPACPVKIDIPWINTVVRDRINRAGDRGQFDFLVDGLTPDAEGGSSRENAPEIQKRLFGNVGTLAKLGSSLAPLSNWVAGSDPAKWLLEWSAGVDRRRDLPRFRRETLVEWFRNREDATANPPGAGGDRVAASAGAGSARRVVLYPDLYTNHVLVERGKAAVQTLEVLGVEVVVPQLPETGRAPLSQGMIATARASAVALSAALEPYLGRESADSEADRTPAYDIVVIEPSDLAMFREDYGHLLTDDEHERLAAHSYELLEYVYGLLENGASVEKLATADGDEESTVAYHSHCQQRTMELEPYTLAVLSECGYDVTTSDVECCGMAGSFGYKEQFYDLSMDVGETLGKQLRDADAEHVLASGTSCVEQIEDLLDGSVQHPVELLVPEK
jgi:iron-sulfur cluster protein